MRARERKADDERASPRQIDDYDVVYTVGGGKERDYERRDESSNGAFKFFIGEQER